MNSISIICHTNVNISSSFNTVSFDLFIFPVVIFKKAQQRTTTPLEMILANGRA